MMVHRLNKSEQVAMPARLIRAIMIGAMPHLLKTEPEAYSFADLERDRETVWDGVTNPVAVKNLREMKPGEKLVIYHTGDERRAVGTASVVNVDGKDPKTPLIRIKVGRAIEHPRSLADIKQHKLFANSPLVKQGRLSVVPLTDEQYKWLTGD
jgi:predicted RNA-binding protein with PUA-like domain